MYIPFLPQDELLKLRESASTIRAELYNIENDLRAGKFCPALVSYAKEMVSLLDYLDETCIENLLLEDELQNNEENVACDSAHIRHESAAYREQRI